MYLNMIISGGQTGADLAGWKAAKRFGILTNGWMPLGFKNESGFHPEYAAIYNARVTSESGYRTRTGLNVEESDITLWFGRTNSPGYFLTEEFSRKHLKSFYCVKSLNPNEIITVQRFIKIYSYKKINIAGNRESTNPGIGQFTENFLCELFKELGHAG